MSDDLINRLNRANGYMRTYYVYHKGTGKLIDVVRSNHSGGIGRYVADYHDMAEYDLLVSTTIREPAEQNSDATP